MSDSTYDYFWINNEIVIVEYLGEGIDKQYWEYYCVDGGIEKQYPVSRYGRYLVSMDGSWEPIHKEDMPPEFMVQLMLLGVE